MIMLLNWQNCFTYSKQFHKSQIAVTNGHKRNTKYFDNILGVVKRYQESIKNHKQKRKLSYFHFTIVNFMYIDRTISKFISLLYWAYRIIIQFYDKIYISVLFMHKYILFWMKSNIILASISWNYFNLWKLTTFLIFRNFYLAYKISKAYRNIPIEISRWNTQIPQILLSQ